MNVNRFPEYEIRVYGTADELPVEAQLLFAKQLSDSRRAMAAAHGDPGAWQYALVCAVTSDGHVLGGVHLDIGPIGGGGPLSGEKLAFLERTLVRPVYRRQGLATRLLNAAMEVARRQGCHYVRCSNNWDNEAERRLFLRCGFALLDLDGEQDEEPCYLAVRPLNLGR